MFEPSVVAFLTTGKGDGVVRRSSGGMTSQKPVPMPGRPKYLKPPKGLRAMKNDPNAKEWEKARQIEFKGLHENGTFSDLVPRSSLPPGTSVLPLFDVFENKDINGGPVTSGLDFTAPFNARPRNMAICWLLRISSCITHNRANR